MINIEDYISTERFFATKNCNIGMLSENENFPLPPKNDFNSFKRTNLYQDCSTSGDSSNSLESSHKSKIVQRFYVIPSLFPNRPSTVFVPDPDLTHYPTSKII